MGRKRKKILLENITISDAGAKGKAVTKLNNGLVVFVEGAVPGDVCDVLVHKKRNSFMEGRPVKFHSYSNLRREAVCEHFGLCGGCKWQFMDYKHQLHFKQKEVEDSLHYLKARPVEWLSDNISLSKDYHLVHATHLVEKEINAIANSKANVVICPSTEGNLGDGIFPLRNYLSNNGNWSIGTDSHIGINPMEEIKLLD